MARKNIVKHTSPRSKGSQISDFIVQKFPGLITRVKDPKEIAKGGASDSKNWLTGTFSDHIELVMGISLLGQTRTTGLGKITGLRVGIRNDGTQFPFFSYLRKIKYYNPATDDTVEVGADMLPAAASGEDVAMDIYSNLAGAFLYASSRHSSIYKIPIANPGSAVDQLSTAFKGLIKIKQNRMMLWNNLVAASGASDFTGLNLSYVDKSAYSQYTTISNENAGTGDGATKHFTGTLAFKAAGAKRTCFAILLDGVIAAVTNITNITKAASAVITAAGHGLAAGDIVIITGISASNNGTGTATTTGNQTVTGTGAAFTTQLKVGGSITVGGDTRVIQSITNDNLLTTTANFPAHAATVYTFASMSEINNQILSVVSVADANTFTVAFDSSASTFYNSGGTVGKCETFLDDKNGNLTSGAGGTGTINYATGAFDVTFNTAPVNGQPILTTYLWEDATSQGICDFSFSSPRTVGQGDYFPQADGGGTFMSLFSFGADEYCIHLLKTWVLTLTSNDTNATNDLYRTRVGIPYWRAAIDTGDGIPYLDYQDKNNPMFRILTLDSLAQQVIPKPLSDQIDLSSYAFDFPVVYEWGNYYILCCQKITNGVHDTFNSVMFVYNKIGKFWDRLDYNASVLETYNGNLIAGDPLSNNVFTLFSGYDYDGDIVDNYWISGQHDLAVNGRKKFYKFIIDGYINTSQNFDILIAYDNGGFTKIGNIDGAGSYVDTGSGILVGGQTIGTQIIGSTGSVNAFHFRKEFTVASDQFEFAQIKFVANAIGALQINSYGFADIRYKGRRVAAQYYS